jgi:mRNA interferase RelE/StbE
VSWDYRIEDSAKRDLRDLGPSVAREVRDFLEKRIKGVDDPTVFGKSLRGELKGFWRYRVKDHRILCRLEHQVLIVVVIAVGHRSTVYDG